MLCQGRSHQSADTSCHSAQGQLPSNCLMQPCAQQPHLLREQLEVREQLFLSGLQDGCCPISPMGAVREDAEQALCMLSAAGIPCASAPPQAARGA